MVNCRHTTTIAEGKKMSPLQEMLFRRPAPIPPGIGRVVNNGDDEFPTTNAVCVKCGEEKSIGLFYSNGPGRRYSSCAECVLNAKREQRKEKRNGKH